jgi:ESCRT-II complex subunit VPS22
MRRVGVGGGGVGLGAAHRSQAAALRTQEVANSLAVDRARHIEEQVAVFRTALESFATKYRAEINRDPAFRHQFIRMAKSIGVDPLASSKGFWADSLGVGSFYFDLAVQVADVCLSTRGANGGLISMRELLARLHRMRGTTAAAAGLVSEDDVRRALKKLAVLGAGYSVVTLGAGVGGGGGGVERFVLSVPADMAQDSTAVLQHARGVGGSVGPSGLARGLGWPLERCERALVGLVREGLAWVDEQAWRGGEGADDGAGDRVRYYFPSVMAIGAGAGGQAGGAGAGAGGGGGGGGGGGRGGAGSSAPSLTAEDDI